MGRIGKAPEWILKYGAQIKAGTITAEEIHEAENRIRSAPIKLVTVMRAINAMGFTISGLRTGEPARSAAMTDVQEQKASGPEERIKCGPGWLQKYRDRIENGTIMPEEIQEAENRIRSAPIKLATVTRAINAMGFAISSLRTEEKVEVAAIEVAVPEKDREPHEPHVMDTSPYWIRNYGEEIEGGTITAEEIQEAENRIRSVPIKLVTVTRAMNTLSRPTTDSGERRKAGLKRGEGVYVSDIGKISEVTAKKFNSIKDDWENDLGKSMSNDHFLNILLTLAKLLEHGKTLAKAK
ncbi:MAG: hypothetical protein WAV32_09300 [Halobacteriota archaeon]